MFPWIRIPAAILVVAILMTIARRVFLTSNLMAIRYLPPWIGLPLLWLMRLSPSLNLFLLAGFPFRMIITGNHILDICFFILSICFVIILAVNAPQTKVTRFRFALGSATCIFLLSMILKLLGLMILPGYFYISWQIILIEPVIWFAIDLILFTGLSGKCRIFSL